MCRYIFLWALLAVLGHSWAFTWPAAAAQGDVAQGTGGTQHNQHSTVINGDVYIDNRNAASGFAGTWRDPESGDIVTSVIAPRQPAVPQGQTQIYAVPSIESPQQGGQHVGPHYPGHYPNHPGQPGLRPKPPHMGGPGMPPGMRPPHAHGAHPGMGGR